MGDIISADIEGDEYKCRVTGIAKSNATVVDINVSYEETPDAGCVGFNMAYYGESTYFMLAADESLLSLDTAEAFALLFSDETDIDELVAALRGINLTVSDGDMLVITGPSGSGKSTLLHILALLDSRYDGELIYNDRIISKLSDAEKSSLRNREIGLVMQDYGLVGEMTAQENVEIPLTVAGVGKKRHADAHARHLNVLGWLISRDITQIF